MRSLLGRFHRPMSRGLVNNMLTMNNLGDGSTLSLDFTTGVLDPRLTFTRASTVATYINSSGYVATATTNEPRFDYTGGVAKGLLIENAATNLCAYGQYCWGGTWGTAQEVHINSVNGTSGTQYVDRIAGPDNGTLTGTSVFKQAGSTYVRLNTVETVSALQQYTYSMWVRAGTGGATYFQLAPFNGSSPMTTVGSCSDSGVTINNTSAFGSTFSNLPSDRWVRVSVVFTTVSGQSSVLLTVYPNLFTNAASTNYIWGAQLELGSGASSTILTGASQVTRNGDICYIPISSIGFSTSGGTFFTSFYRGEVDGGFPAQASSVINTDYADTRWLGIGSGYGSTTFGFGAWNGSINKTGAGVFGLNKAAGSYASWVTSTTGIFTVNGATAVTGTLSNLGTTPNYLMIGSASQSSPYNGVGLRDYHNNSIRSIKYFPTALTAAQLQTLTAL